MMKDELVKWGQGDQGGGNQAGMAARQALQSSLYKTVYLERL